MRASDSDRVLAFRGARSGASRQRPAAANSPRIPVDALTLERHPERESRQLIVAAESASRFHSSIASQIKNT